MHPPCRRAVPRRPRRLGRRASGPAVCQLVSVVRPLAQLRMCRLQILVKRIREQACAVNECNYDDFSLWFEHLIEHSVGPMHNRLLAVQGCPRPALTTLLAKPLRHAPLDFILFNEFTALGCFKTASDRLLNVDVVVNVFKRGFFGQRIEQLANFFFRLAHVAILTPIVTCLSPGRSHASG